MHHANVRGKQTKSSFKPKNHISTTRVLELLHLDLFGPMSIISFGGTLLSVQIQYENYENQGDASIIESANNVETLQG